MQQKIQLSGLKIIQYNLYLHYLHFQILYCNKSVNAAKIALMMLD